MVGLRVQGFGVGFFGSGCGDLAPHVVSHCRGKTSFDIRSAASRRLSDCRVRKFVAKTLNPKS